MLKMHQKPFGFTRTRWGSLSAPPNPPASRNMGPISKGKGREGGKGKEKEK